ncbi:hypothetical protein PG989_014355 [Apiospora arundinis]
MSGLTTFMRCSRRFWIGRQRMRRRQIMRTRRRSVRRIRNVATFFSSGTPNLDTLDPACGIPVNEYFWLNSLHPTYPMHDVVAEQVVATLEKGPNVC